MRIRLWIRTLCVAGLVMSASSTAQADQVVLLPLFNGKDLSGWKVPKGNIWWKVEKGVLVCQSGPNKRGSTLWTEEKFADFHLELDFRYQGQVDTGVFLRTSKQQVQIGVSRSLKRDMTGSVYVSGKGYPGRAEGVAKLLKIGEWNRMSIEARGPKYVVSLNGKQVLTYTAEKVPATGPIGLQLHGGVDMRVEFRGLRIAKLRQAATR